MKILCSCMTTDHEWRALELLESSVPPELWAVAHSSTLYEYIIILTLDINIYTSPCHTLHLSRLWLMVNCYLWSVWLPSFSEKNPGNSFEQISESRPLKEIEGKKLMMLIISFHCNFGWMSRVRELWQISKVMFLCFVSVLFSYIINFIFKQLISHARNLLILICCQMCKLSLRIV